MKDARERMAIGLYLLVLIVLIALFFKPDLADVKLFELLAQGIVMQGFLQLAGAYYFTASKSGVELAESNSRVVAASAIAASDLAANGPAPVVVTNSTDNPVPVEEPKG